MNFPASVSRQCDDLAQLLGTVCSPYLRSPDAPSSELPSLSRHDTACRTDWKFVLEAMNDATSTKRGALVAASGHGSVFAIPLNGEEKSKSDQWFAIGRTQEPPTESGRQLIHIASEAIQRQHRIELQERAILHAESEIERSFHERAWLRQLNAPRAIRKKTIGQQSQKSMESLRSLIDAEAIAIYLYPDSEAEDHGLESMIYGKPAWTLDDVRILIQRIQKPRCGESVVLNQLDQQLPHGICHSCAVVPIGESEPIGYVLAINGRTKSPSTLAKRDTGFVSADTELLHEVAGHIAADGFSNASLLESEQLVLGTLRAMSNAIEARDPYTHGHSERVGSVAYQIALRLELSEAACQEIYLAGVLHDIGKIGVPDHVLLKTGRLEPEEFDIIRKHPEIGHRIIEELGKLKFALPGVLYHHERVDGTGYPHNLVGDEIPLMARILSVADAYDAMTSSRVYRSAMGQQQSLAILRGGMRTQWDAEVVTACLQYVSEVSLESEANRHESSRSKSSDWRQVSHALRVLQL